MNAAAFFGIDLGTSTSFKVMTTIKQGGNLVNSKSMSDLINYLSSTGWNAVAPATVSATLTSTLAGIAAARMLSIPVLMFAPAALGLDDFDKWFNDNFAPPEVQG